MDKIFEILGIKDLISIGTFVELYSLHKNKVDLFIPTLYYFILNVFFVIAIPLTVLTYFGIGFTQIVGILLLYHLGSDYIRMLSSKICLMIFFNNNPLEYIVAFARYQKMRQEALGEPVEKQVEENIEFEVIERSEKPFVRFKDTDVYEFITLKWVTKDGEEIKKFQYMGISNSDECYLKDKEILLEPGIIYKEIE